MGGHPKDLHIRKKKVHFGELKSLGVGKSQRYISFTAIQEVPLEKGPDYIFFREVSAWEIWFAEWAVTPVKPRSDLLVEWIGLCLLEQGGDGPEPF